MAASGGDAKLFARVGASQNEQERVPSVALSVDASL